MGIYISQNYVILNSFVVSNSEVKVETGSVPPAKVKKTDLETCLIKAMNYFIKSTLGLHSAIIYLRFSIFMWVSAK